MNKIISTLDIKKRSHDDKSVTCIRTASINPT